MSSGTFYRLREAFSIRKNQKFTNKLAVSNRYHFLWFNLENKSKGKYCEEITVLAQPNFPFIFSYRKLNFRHFLLSIKAKTLVFRFLYKRGPKYFFLIQFTVCWEKRLIENLKFDNTVKRPYFDTLFSENSVFL